MLPFAPCCQLHFAALSSPVLPFRFPAPPALPFCLPPSFASVALIVIMVVSGGDPGRCRRIRTGTYVIDTMALREQLSAMTAISAAHAKAGLSREFGVE